MSVIIFILILAVLIIVHEYGHFIVAKKWGIRVDEFGLGYPPRAKVLFKKKGTLFTLNWIPFGGFVKIFGEDPDDPPAEEVRASESLNGENKSVALTSKSKFAQASVMFAGPLFNFIFAWFVILVSVFIGLPSSVDSSYEDNIVNVQNIITEVVKDSPADDAGISVGDSIESVTWQGASFDSLTDVPFENVKEGDIIELDIKRDGNVI